MVNTMLLDWRIREMHLKYKDLARVLNLSPYTLYRKRHGEKEFTVREMLTLCRVLELSEAERDAIFFG